MGNKEPTTCISCEMRTNIQTQNIYHTKKQGKYSIQPNVYGTIGPNISNNLFSFLKDIGLDK